MNFWKCKTGRKLLLALFAGAYVCAEARAQESWVPVGPPPWTNTMIQTVGGVTYFTASATLAACDGVISEPLLRSGTNLVQTFYEGRWTGICVACIDCYYNATNVAVLGVLPAGDYLYTILSYPPFGGQPLPFARFQFSVPSLQTPTLSGWVDAKAGGLHLAVAGIPNVKYVIQASNDLTNWTSLVTNVGAPFFWSDPLVPQVTNRFYRTRIIGD